MRDFLKTYGLVLLICLSVRAGYMITCPRLPPRPAFDGYTQIAENLLSGHGLTPSPLRHFHLRTPVYPLLIAGVWALVPSPSRLVTLAAVQAGLSVATCGLLMLATRSVFSLRAAWAAGILFALSPSYTLFSALVYTETLQLFLLMLAILAAARLSKTASLLDAAGLGALWGLVGLNRPEATFLVPVLALPFVLGHNISMRRRAAGISLMLAINMLVMSPWIMRNYSVYQTFVLHVPATGMNLYGGSYPKPPMYGRGWYHAEHLDHDIAYWETPDYLSIVEPYWDREAMKSRPHWHEEVLTRSERDFLAIDRALAAAARRQILNDPLRFVRNLVSHLSMLWARPAAWDVAQPVAILRLVWFLAHVAFIALAALGAVMTARARKLTGTAGAWVAFVVCHTLVILPIVTEPRYQAASAPILFAFAGLALARLFHFGNRDPFVLETSHKSTT